MYLYSIPETTLFKGKPQRTPKNKEHMGSLTLLEAY
jgi:hypothetical protein